MPTETPCVIAVGQPYPLPLPLQPAYGAAAQFLMKSGNVLQICLPGIDGQELTALRSGVMTAGFLYEAGALLWLFQFHKPDGKPLLTFDAPFDFRLLPYEQRDVPVMDNPEQHLAIEVHVIDERQITQALRYITLPPELTQKFLSAAQAQLNSASSGRAAMETWFKAQPDQLARQAAMWRLGV